MRLLKSKLAPSDTTVDMEDKHLHVSRFQAFCTEEDQRLGVRMMLFA